MASDKPLPTEHTGHAMTGITTTDRRLNLDVWVHTTMLGEDDADERLEGNAVRGIE